MFNEDVENVLDQLERLVDNDVEIELSNASDKDSVSYHLFKRLEFREGQLGYRLDPEGKILTGEESGDWDDDWYVIGYEEDTGDPLFVDISNKDYPVMTAPNGEGDWNAEKMFDSLDDFIQAISE